MAVKPSKEYMEIKQRLEGLQLALLDFKEEECSVKREDVLTGKIDALKTFVNHSNMYYNETEEYFDNYLEMLLWAYHKYYPENNLPRTVKNYDPTKTKRKNQ